MSVLRRWTGVSRCGGRRLSFELGIGGTLARVVCILCWQRSRGEKRAKQCMPLEKCRWWSGAIPKLHRPPNNVANYCRDTTSCYKNTHTPLLHIPVHLRETQPLPLFPFFPDRLAHGNLACPLSTQGSVTPVPS